MPAEVSDPDEMERLGDLVIRHDSARVLSADTAQPLMTTAEILQIEDQLAIDAAALTDTPSAITRFNVDDAFAAYEAQQSAQRSQPFRLSNEQRETLQRLSLGSLVAIDGLPGVGKTTLMGAVRVLGEVTRREVVGLTLSQAAAERLESEAGFRCVNTARARILEEGHHPVIPENGIVVVDEAAMIDSRANGRILELARQRGSVVLEVGDLRQLQPIDFGASFRIVRDVARQAGTYCELREIQRQRRGWHRGAVAKLADAIAERDESQRLALVRDALRIFDENGALVWVDERNGAIDSAVTRSVAHQSAGYDTLTMASDKDTVRHLSEQERRQGGLEGKGRRYMTDSGAREFAVGDRLMFLENSLGKRGLGVRNGDRGTVLQISNERIVVEMDGAQGRAVSFSPRTYKSFDYANACTVHKAQGASVDAAVCVIDRSACAELLFVAASRSKRELDIVVPRTAFRDLNEMAEHVTAHLSLKTTTRTYDEILSRTGGKQTVRVRNMEAQREATPLRRLYDADVVEPLRAIQVERIDHARENYRLRKDEIATSPLSVEERLDASRQALRDMRRSVAMIYRQLEPQPFGQWLQERDELRDRMRRASGWHQEQRQEREQEHQHDREDDRRAGEFSRARHADQSQELRRDR